MATPRKPKELHLPKGAPTKWTPGINDALTDYFRTGNARDFPTFEEFGCDNDIHVDTMVEWCKPENAGKYPGFSEAYAKAKQRQHSLVTRHAITGKYAAAFSIFFAKNNMGMSDSHDHRHSGALGFYDILDDPGYADQGEAQ